VRKVGGDDINNGEVAVCGGGLASWERMFDDYQIAAAGLSLASVRQNLGYSLVRSQTDVVLLEVGVMGAHNEDRKGGIGDGRMPEMRLETKLAVAGAAIKPSLQKIDLPEGDVVRFHEKYGGVVRGNSPRV
jgi:hypothetical protein